jgi:hypothetical protein
MASVTKRPIEMKDLGPYVSGNAVFEIETNQKEYFIGRLKAAVVEIDPKDGSRRLSVRLGFLARAIVKKSALPMPPYDRKREKPEMRFSEEYYVAEAGSIRRDFALHFDLGISVQEWVNGADLRIKTRGRETVIITFDQNKVQRLERIEGKTGKPQ